MSCYPERRHAQVSHVQSRRQGSSGPRTSEQGEYLQPSLPGAQDHRFLALPVEARVFGTGAQPVQFRRPGDGNGAGPHRRSGTDGRSADHGGGGGTKSFHCAQLPLAAQRAAIRSLASQYPVRLLCALLEVPPSSCYYHPHAGDDPSLLADIEQVLGEHPTYGYRRVTAQLQRQGEPVNHKRVARVRQDNDLLQTLHPRVVHTTNSRHGFGRYPNLVAGLVVDHPDPVWCADLTYIQMRRQTAYLVILLNVFTRSLRGWHLGLHLDTQLTLTALDQAHLRHVPDDPSL